MTNEIYTLKSWNNANPETVVGLSKAREVAEKRAKSEGAIIRMSANVEPGADFYSFQTVAADGHWSRWNTEALPGSLSAMEEDDGSDLE